jgi:predicted Rdx family selenoprotein
MIDPTTVDEIIAQYAKHGWVLRRALLSDDAMRSLAKTLGDVEIQPSDFDAVWFSRRSKPESEAWELRRLSGLPFALVAVVSSDATTEEVEATLSQVVEEMRAKTLA